MTKRWTQRPPGSTWGDWGDDDELGRINLLTPEKVLEGVREVEAGISFCLSLPLDYPGGTALNQRRHPPVLAPTEDMNGKPGVFYNVRMSEMADWGDPKYVDVWADDVVTLSLQYSTQWDSLAHVGAEFDADGDGVEEAVYYNGYRAGVDLVGPQRRRGRRRRRPPQLRAPPRARAHGVPRGSGPRRARRPGPPPRRRLARREPATLHEIMAADNVVVEPGDMLLLHTGFATRILEWNRNPDPRKLFTTCSYLDARDEALLEWIADSQISALVADNYAVEGLLGKDRDPSRHSFLPIHNLCLFKLGRAAGGDVVPARAGRVAARARPQPLPADRAAAAPARHRRLAADAGRHRLIEFGGATLARLGRLGRLMGQLAGDLAGRLSVVSVASFGSGWSV